MRHGLLLSNGCTRSCRHLFEKRRNKGSSVRHHPRRQWMFCWMNLDVFPRSSHRSCTTCFAASASPLDGTCPFRSCSRNNFSNKLALNFSTRSSGRFLIGFQDHASESHVTHMSLQTIDAMRIVDSSMSCKYPFEQLVPCGLSTPLDGTRCDHSRTHCDHQSLTTGGISWQVTRASTIFLRWTHWCAQSLCVTLFNIGKCFCLWHPPFTTACHYQRNCEHSCSPSDRSTHTGTT